MKSISKNLFRLIVALILPFIWGCGANRAFEPQFRDIEEPERSMVMDALEAIELPEERPIVCGIDGNGQLYVWDFKAGEMLWSRPVKAKSMPIVVGNLILLQEEKGPLARRLENGDEAFTLDKDARIVGGHSDGKHTAISIELGPTGNPRGYLVGVENEEKIWTNDLSLPVGVPVVLNGMVVVPWANQRVSLLDATTGVEKTRFHMSDTVVGTVFVDRNVVYMGQQGLMHVTKNIEAGTKDKLGYFEPKIKELPANPEFIRDGYKSLPSPDDSYHRVRLLWQPKIKDNSVNIENNTVYFLFHRLVFAFHPEKDKLKWIYQSPVNIVGAKAFGNALLLATADGTLLALDAKSGVPGFEAEMNMPVKTAYFRNGTYLPQVKPNQKNKSLYQQITAVIELDDNTLSPGIALAVEYLKEHKPQEATKQLVDICSDTGKLPVIREAACKTLSTRNNGQKFVAAALKKRASFLKGNPPPPSGSLALAAANMGLRNTVPDLIDHLNDPATPASEIKGILMALGKLGTGQTAETIEQFLALYHAETEDTALINSLRAAPEALIDIKGEKAKDVLLPIAKDPLTAKSLAKQTEEALATLSKSSDSGEKKEKAEGTGESGSAQEETPPPEKEKDKRAHALTGEMVRDVMSPLNEELKKCVPKDFRKVKIVLLVNPTGSIQSIFTVPSEAQKCISGVLKNQKFPATQKDDPEQVIYLVRK